MLAKDDPVSNATPFFSIVIAVFNDWTPLDSCLRSLVATTDSPNFEVIIVDDGSREEAPQSIRHWRQSFPLTIIRQPHAGIASARNRGIQISVGSFLVFVDADCRFHTHCLAVLYSTIANSPQHNCFQLHLTGDCSVLVGRAEELRLITLQKQLLQPNGCIRYVNTAGFAIRRAHVDTEAGVFNPLARRGEDTLLLANLIQAGELPFFVADAVVQHAISLSVGKCLLKDIRSGYLEGRTFDIIAAKGVRIRLTHRERFNMLWSMWKTSRQRPIGRSGLLLLIVRQALERIASLGHLSLRFLFNARPTVDSSR